MSSIKVLSFRVVGYVEIRQTRKIPANPNRLAISTMAAMMEIVNERNFVRACHLGLNTNNDSPSAIK